MIFDVSRCVDYNDFSIKLNDIEKFLENNKIQNTNTLNKILEFLEANQTIFIQEKRAALPLNSLGAKLRNLPGNEPVIKKLRHYVSLLTPSTPKGNFFQFIESAIKDIADWIYVMRIADKLEFTEEEFVGIVTRLEYPDLTHFNFQSMNLKKLTQLLLTDNLKFKTKDTFFLLNLAKVCAQENGEDTAKYIQNFAIDDETVRVEIAKICAQENGEGTAKYIKNFAINDETAKVEIAKLCTQNDGVWTALYISDNFAITEEKARVEIAKLMAKKNPRMTNENIQNFAIANEQARVEIAKICAQDGRSVNYHIEIQYFAIQDEAARIEIATICAQQNALWTTYHIQRFTIRDEAARIEIAKICAKRNGGKTAPNIQNFAIKDEVARIEIAKLCAKQNGQRTAEHIQNFAIGDEAIKIEIAKLCADETGKGVVLHLDNFQIGNLHSLYLLFLYCAQREPKSIFHVDNIPSLAKELIRIADLIQIFQILKSETLNESHKKELFEQIRNLIQKIFTSNENRQTLFEMSERIQALPSHVQSSAGLWLGSSLLLMKEIKPENIDWLLGTKIWIELGLLKDPILRVSLSSCLHALSADSERATLWNDFLHNLRGTQGQRGLMLLVVPFFSLQLHGIGGDKLLAVANHLSALQKKNASSLRNSYQVKNLLHAMHSLASNTDLTAEHKKRGFEKIFFDTSTGAMIDNEGQILKNVIAAKRLLQLRDTRWPNVSENLSLIFRSSLEKLIPLLQFDENLSQKYEEIWGKCRNPEGLLTFAAGLKSLEEPVLLSCLGQYMSWVMDATFKDKRYDTAYNPHLAKVLEGNPDLLSKWTEEIKLDFQATISGDKKEDPFDPEQWLHTKLLVDNRLDCEKLAYLMEYIKAPSDSRKEIFAALLREIKKLMTEGETEVLTLRKKLDEAEKKIKAIETNLKKDKRNEELVTKMSEEKKEIKESIVSLARKLKTFSASRANDPVWVNLHLQKACLTFAEEGKVSDRKSLIAYVEKINQSLTFYKSSKFAMDVKGLLETLKNQTESYSDSHLHAVFTDDPIDLLLCGTDVSGSCQRLDDDPKKNKGLLGYLIDGKNRLIAIKDGDKIVSRCLLRLLWDGKQPVVYRDRFYPDQIPATHKQALNALAKQVSQKLAVPLTCGEGSVPYNNSLQALGGPAPYEYCDGAGGVQKDGRYTIQARLLE